MTSKLLANKHCQKPLTDDRLDQFTMHIRQPPIDPVMAERQPFVIDPQQVKDRRMQVIGIGGGSSFPGPFIAFAKRSPRPNPPAREPANRRPAIVIAAGASLTERHAAELGGPDDQRSVNHA